MRAARTSSSSVELASARRFRSSAVSGSMCSSEAMASVISLPPVMRMRTNRGTPRSCTTTLVTPLPTQTIASLVPSASPNMISVVASARMSEKGMTSTSEGDSPAPSTAASSERTMSLCAATSRIRIIGCWSGPTNCSRIWKSRMASSTGMGMSSCTWYRSADRRSSSAMAGSSAWRTITRWFATPTITSRPLKPTSVQRRRMAAATAGGSTTSPSRTAPRGNATWPNRFRVA